MVAVVVVLGVAGTVAIFAATAKHEPVARLALPPSASIGAPERRHLSGDVVNTTGPRSTAPAVGNPIGPASRSGEAGPSSTAKGAPQFSWRRLPLHLDNTEAATSAGLAAIAAMPDQGFIAVGNHDDGPLVVGSADGERWARLGTRDAALEGARLRDVVVVPQAIFAVGSAKGRPAAWTSTDGATWDAVPISGALTMGVLNAVAADRAGHIVAAGFSLGASGLWYFDGRSFAAVRAEAAAIAAAADAHGQVFSDVTAGRSGFLAVGNDGNGRAIAWYSRAEEPWTSAAVDSGPSTSMSSLAVTGAGVVAVGYDDAGPRAWFSRDGGASWMVADAPPRSPEAVQVPVAVIADGPGGLAVGQDGNATLCWISADGRRWQRCAGPRPTGAAIARGVVAVPDGYLIVGSTARGQGQVENQAGDEGEPSLWRVEVLQDGSRVP